MTQFRDIQQQFMAHIRNPEDNPGVNGIEDRRLKIYRELFFNNIKGFLSSGFPVLASLYSEHQWESLARGFFKQHQCRSPYFVDISKEFVEFLSNEYELATDDFPFLKELAHYEWLELDLSIRKDVISDKIWDGQSEISMVSFSPLAQLVSYTYPVHQISTKFSPQEPLAEPVYLVVHRDVSDAVEFTQVNAVTALLLDLIQQAEKKTLSELVYDIQQQLPDIAEHQLIKATQDIIQQMLEKQILLPSTSNIAN
ncbi:MAG: DUF2063 domain-containing protein [Aestuariibacter sp.]